MITNVLLTGGLTLLTPKASSGASMPLYLFGYLKF